VRTGKVFHLVNFIAGMQLIVSNAHQRKALSVTLKHLKNCVKEEGYILLEFMFAEQLTEGMVNNN
jgi:hypothetical protein